MKKKEKKVKKPFITSFNKQTMISWVPLLTPPWSITIFIIIAAIYIPVGLFIYNGQDNV
jgi:hypothetical protein